MLCALVSDTNLEHNIPAHTQVTWEAVGVGKCTMRLLEGAAGAKQALTVSQPVPGCMSLKAAVDWLCSKSSRSAPAILSLPQCDLSTTTTPSDSASNTWAVLAKDWATPCSWVNTVYQHRCKQSRCSSTGVNSTDIPEHSVCRAATPMKQPALTRRLSPTAASCFVLDSNACNC
jgi:hypothetical protein